MNLVDLHCHILPYVDDGAFDKDESDVLLKEYQKQNITAVCATPHLRKGMFETPDEEIKKQFSRMKKRAEAAEIPIKFFLSREYHADYLFYEHLKKGEIITLGKGNHILIEFSNMHTEENIRRCLQRITRFGYTPLIAHVERYRVLTGDTDKIKSLINDEGAKIQVNAGSILGREGKKQTKLTHELLDQKLVHVVASDAHDPEKRPPELEKCREYLEKKYGEEYTKKIMYVTPAKILLGKE